MHQWLPRICNIVKNCDQCNITKHWPMQHHKALWSLQYYEKLQSMQCHEKLCSTQSFWYLNHITILNVYLMCAHMNMSVCACMHVHVCVCVRQLKLLVWSVMIATLQNNALTIWAFSSQASMPPLNLTEWLTQKSHPFSFLKTFSSVPLPDIQMCVCVCVCVCMLYALNLEYVQLQNVSA